MISPVDLHPTAATCDSAQVPSATPSAVKVRQRKKFTEVRLGSVLVKVYRSRWRDKKRRKLYRAHTIIYHDLVAGRPVRKREKRSSRQDALDRAAQLAIDLANHRTQRLQATDADLASLHRAQELIAPTGKALELVAADYAEAFSILQPSFSLQPSAFSLARVTYTAGYLLPGDPDPQPPPDNPQPIRLPADLEQAAVEQVAYWFQKRDKLGLKTYWPSGAAYQGFADQDLLESVKVVLRSHQRWSL